MARKDDWDRGGVFFVGGRGIHVISMGVISNDGSGETGLGDLEADLLASLGATAIKATDLVRFDSAHYNYLVYHDLPDSFNIKLHKLSILYATAPGPHAVSLLEKYSQERGFVTPEVPIRDILLRETRLQPAEYRIVPVEKSTRETIDVLLKTLLRRGEYVALPVPNWHFWDLPGHQTGRYGVLPFDALTEDQLVNNFREIATRRKVHALLLTSPSVPLMQKLSEDAGREIDSIATRHGVTIIVDDVLRGVQPIGERQSIGEYFSEPVVVEGFSKRFGDNPFGRLSYILIPPGAKRERFTHLSQENRWGYVLGTALQAADTYSSQPAIDELHNRNLAFDIGFTAECPDVRVVRPSSTHITSLLELPSSWGKKASDVSDALYHQGILVMERDNFYPDDYKQPVTGKEYLRTTIGCMPFPLVGQNARLLGRKIREYTMRGR